MAKLLARFLSVWRERRQADIPVAADRRQKKLSIKDADKKMHDSMERLEQTIRIKRDDLLKFSANDVQQTVVFSTFREICKERVDSGQYRLCRHPKHEAANTGVAICDEQLCPIFRGAA